MYSQQEVEKLILRNSELVEAIRRHRDYKGNQRCFMDDYDLYSVLPEGIMGVDLRLLPPELMLKECEKYVAHRHDPSKPYVCPHDEIADLKDKIAELKEKLSMHHPKEEIW